ncbi:MAG: DMT family transporter [Oscillospiraceae bacterium]|nr:DMT family transporter [Oscillospiraceae bacterium]
MRKGRICLVLSAFIYGLAPLLAKIAYEGGVNGMTLTFLRTVLTVPLLFVLMLLRGQSFKLTLREFGNIAILAVLGGSLSMISLYAAYDYISTGLATTLHFIYPLIIVIVSALIYKEKITKMKLAAVMLVTVGIFLFVDITDAADKIGVILAVLSGVFYSFYVIYIDHSGLSRMDYIKLTFYLMIIMSAGTLAFGLAAKSIGFSEMNGLSWTFSTLISILITLGAIPLFQAGVRYEGASTAGIVSAFEPITTIILGALFLGETMGLVQYFGGAMIIAGVVIAEKY